ncbi:MAG: hypothetical protein IPK10_06260 [Bacteroidetes bacterium]|nr:hypothetical protein [Bacteroidota bacterium]
MKKLLILIPLFLLFLSFNHLQAQDSKIAPTTEEEYVMGSVGYKMFMQMKVALKDNYKVKDINEVEYGDRKGRI